MFKKNPSICFINWNISMQFEKEMYLLWTKFIAPYTRKVNCRTGSLLANNIPIVCVVQLSCIIHLSSVMEKWCSVLLIVSDMLQSSHLAIYKRVTVLFIPYGLINDAANSLDHPSIHPSVRPSVHGSTALCWASAAFQFLNPIHSR
jgi:hypothetical protein